MFSTYIKEFRLLSRDLGGLLLLLLMPAALTIIMAMVQDAPFKDFENVKFNVLVLNNDKGNTGAKIIDALNNNKQFNIIQSINNQEVDSSSFYNSIQNGDYLLGIHIPSNTTKVILETTNDIIKEIAGLETISTQYDESINLIFDPGAKPTVRNALTMALEQEITKTKTNILLERLSKSNGQNMQLNFDRFNVLNLKVINTKPDQPKINISSVQHNVPAWAIFGIFMIVVPISGSIIREREDGSALRIKLIPNAFLKVSLGKILFYISICFLQFIFMVLVGLYIIPLMGLDAIQLSEEWYLLIPMILCIAFTAVSYGYMIGNIFTTSNQANSFGSISIVMLSALGGIWVPIVILPEIMQKIAKVSPLYWSLEGVNNILVRNSGWNGMWLNCLILLTFGLVFTLITVKFKKQVT